MYLPHQPPLKYANHIISLSNEKVVVSAFFEQEPTLAMLCEAAAQSSAAFKQITQDANYGFVVSYKNCKLFTAPIYNSYDITISITQDLGQLCEYNFEVNNNGTLFAKGDFILTFKYLKNIDTNYHFKYCLRILNIKLQIIYEDL